jgi:hypothetical protein
MSRELSPTFCRRIFRNLKEFEHHIVEIIGDSKHWLYRGQGVLDPPAPRYFRERGGLVKSDAETLEQGHIEEFRKTFGQHLPASATSDWGILTWLQHYGAPTRLLDWTCNPMIALWFAARARLDDIESGQANQSSFTTVWLVKTKKEQWATLAELQQRPRDTREVLFAQPPEIDIRVLAQRSVFSVHRLPRSSIDSCWDDLTGMLHGGELICLAADDSTLPGIFKDLRARGVSGQMIYPDLLGAASAVRLSYSAAPPLRQLQSSTGIAWSKT